MAIATGTALAIGAGALIGGVAGSMSDKSTSSSQINLAPESSLEGIFAGRPRGDFDELAYLTGAGAGTSDVAAGAQGSRDLAELLRRLSESGGIPGQEDIAAGRGYARDIFARSREALAQNFTDQTVEAQRLSARLGRPVDDPILQAKLRTGFMRESSLLEADERGLAAQTAFQLPGQRAAYATQRAGVLEGLASQAFRNRAALLEAGSGILGAERNYRLARSGQTVTGEQGGGLKGALSGFLGGAGAGASMGAMFSGGGFRQPAGTRGIGPFASGSTYASAF